MDKEGIRIPKFYLLRALPLVLGAGIISFILLTSPQPSYADPLCGNNITEPGEACDGDDQNGYTCSSVAAGFSGGILSCKADCSGYDVSSCDRGSTIEAQSCAQGDVQVAIGQAQDGDTVLVPAGQCSWNGTLDLDPMPAIVLKGAGVDQTVITDRTPAGGWGNSLIWIESVEGKPFRITGFTFTDQGAADPNGVINIQGTVKNWRVDHNKFEDIHQRAVRTSGFNYGIIDHCTLNIPGDGTVQGILVESDDSGSWERPLSLGTADAVYVEDSIFNYEYDNDGVLDAGDGGRFVFRHNTVANTGIGQHGRDSGGGRSTHSFEIYENTFTTDTRIWTVMNFRGGTGVVFNNEMSGPYSNFSFVSNYCSCYGHTPGYCVFDQCLQYPCIDQIGRSSDMDGDGVQELEPLYEWNNTLNGSDVDTEMNPNFTGCCDPEHIQEGRDYYNDLARLDYVPYVYPHPLVQMDLPSPSADLNEDGRVDVLDVQLCTNVALGVETDPEIVNKADINLDGVVDTLDVLKIIQGILGK